MAEQEDRPQAEESAADEPVPPAGDDAPGPTSSRTTTRSSRSQENVQSRRSSRRTSLGPYPAPIDPAPDRRRTPRARPQPARDEPETASRALPEEDQEDEMEDVAENQERDNSIESTRGKRFELVILQQPEIGAEAGLGKVTLGRLPIVPAPVVQVIVKDEAGEVLDIELPYLFCSCSLRDAEGSATIEYAPVPSTSTTSTNSTAQNGGDEMSALIGNLVRNPYRVPDLRGDIVSVFVFDDMSVRMQGKFTLEFTLGEAREAQSPKLAAVVSEPFDVVEWKEYPGRPAADTVPELSMHLHNQGIQLYIPPLVLTQPLGSPPPPSSNPFPTDHHPGQAQSPYERNEREQTPREGDVAPPATP
ncbi:hypothetical protein JCM16303_004150 [Sporobolomyces ruberrimus]